MGDRVAARSDHRAPGRLVRPRRVSTGGGPAGLRAGGGGARAGRRRARRDPRRGSGVRSSGARRDRAGVRAGRGDRRQRRRRPARDPVAGPDRPGTRGSRGPHRWGGTVGRCPRACDLVPRAQPRERPVPAARAWDPRFADRRRDRRSDAATPAVDVGASARGRSARFPDAFVGLPPVPAPPVDPPPTSVVAAAADATRASTVEVLASGCIEGYLNQGSGFVVAPGYIVTNAHVVAGTHGQVLASNGARFPAGVVFFDPGSTSRFSTLPAFQAPPLALATGVVPRGTGGAVLGFPGGGGLQVGPAAVRQTLDAVGRDIYGHGEVDPAHRRAASDGASRQQRRPLRAPRRARGRGGVRELRARRRRDLRHHGGPVRPGRPRRRWAHRAGGHRLVHVGLARHELETGRTHARADESAPLRPDAERLDRQVGSGIAIEREQRRPCARHAPWQMGRVEHADDVVERRDQLDQQPQPRVLVDPVAEGGLERDGSRVSPSTTSAAWAMLKTASSRATVGLSTARAALVASRFAGTMATGRRSGCGSRRRHDPVGRRRS